MLLIRPPGVYAPQADTWLLRNALRDAGLAPGARVLDLCTGTGVLAMAALRMGARTALALDSSTRAVLAARCNARLHRLPLTVRRGDVFAAVGGDGGDGGDGEDGGDGGDGEDGGPLGGRRFDLVLANPPYVPSPNRLPPRRGSARSWDGGPDGRAVLDRLCDRAPSLLERGGSLLLVHSDLCGTDATLKRLEGRGLEASVAARSTVPFGPVLRGRAAWLESRGLIAPGQRVEELVVVRADRP